MIPRALILLACAALLCACPHKPSDDLAQHLQPTATIPQSSPLLTYDSFHLGMSNLEVAQKFNAPSGKGKGFKRGVEDYGDVRNQIIDFDPLKGQPMRRVVLRLYQDKLAKLVDRRDHLSGKQAAEWLAALKKTYGAPKAETLPGAEWLWGDPQELSLTYTQDNRSPSDMTATVVLEHKPTADAAENYLHYRASKGQ